jgi:hypothetical protein
MEEPVSSDAEATAAVGDTIIDPSAERAYQQVLDQIEACEVRDLADQLDERERAVIRAHYGLGQPAQTLNQIGGALGLTAERARQIEIGALGKLRDRWRADLKLVSVCANSSGLHQYRVRSRKGRPASALSGRARTTAIPDESGRESAGGSESS